MTYNIDTIIFVGFLIVTIITGLRASQGITNIRQYAIGDKTFSTAMLVSTIVATWVGGEFFLSGIVETFNQGLGFVIVIVLGDFIVLFTIGAFLAHRMDEFRNNISIADAMGDMYGNIVRLITVFGGVLLASGIIAVQLQIAGILFEYALGVSKFSGIIISGIIITFYSALGGIKSVTFTDYIQFIMFIVVIPMITLFLNDNIPNHEMILNTIQTNKSFDPAYVFSFENPEIYYLISIFIWSIIPSFNPAVFQRVVMAKDSKQVKESFIIASLISPFLMFMVCWIGVLTLTSFGDLQSENIFATILDQTSLAYGFKGLLLAGILAMVMSTVDSYINSTSVLIVYDIGQVLKSKNSSILQNELMVTKICSLIIGVFSILFAMRSGSFLDLFIRAGMFYMPVVTAPFIMAVLGFRSSTKAVLIAMAVGFSVAMVWEEFFKIENIGGVLPGFFANLITLFAAHYLLRQPGGWVKGSIEPKKNIIDNFLNIYKCFRNFKLLSFLQNNTPKTEGQVAILGAYVTLSTISLINIFKPEIISFSIYKLYFAVLLFSSLLISYPLLKSKLSYKLFLPVIWNSAIFFLLICFSFFTVLISNFASVPLIIFLVNIIVVSAVIRWRALFLYLVIGTIGSFVVYDQFTSITSIEAPALFTEFKITYLFLLISAAVLVFLKPKDDYMQSNETKLEKSESQINTLHNEAQEYKEKADHFSEKIDHQAKEIERLGATAQRILNNLNHELRLPVGNVMNFSEMLHEGLGKYSNEQLKELSDEVYKNSTRLSSMILNMLDLATLNARKLEIVREKVNIGDLVKERITCCKKIYLQGKPIKFKETIESNIIIEVDANYMKQVVDNLIINAINFSTGGVIEIKITQQENKVIFQITDEGIGIPITDLYDIFTPFKMGSNTESKAEGRGVGLALCKAAIEAHGGNIEAKSQKRGAVFIITLPK